MGGGQTQVRGREQVEVISSWTGKQNVIEDTEE